MAQNVELTHDLRLDQNVSAGDVIDEAHEE